MQGFDDTYSGSRSCGAAILNGEVVGMTRWIGRSSR